MKFEELVSIVESVKPSHPKSEGWSCQEIIKALGMDARVARDLLRKAVDAGVLVQKPYIVTALNGTTYTRMGLGLATTTTGRKKTKRS
jgi:hypothetical protein